MDDELEHMSFAAEEQTRWESVNGKMVDILPGTPIGQIMEYHGGQRALES